MPQPLTEAEAGFLFGFQAASAGSTLAEKADALERWRGQKRRRRTGRAQGVARPSETTVARVLSGESHPEVFNEVAPAETRGRKRTITDKLANKIPRIIDKLEKKYPKQNVVMRMITQELAERVPSGEAAPSEAVVHKEV